MWVLFFSILMSSNLSAEEINKNCEISVRYFHKTGSESVKSYQLTANSKTDCEKKSKLYKENSTPNNVNKKEVKVKWLGN